MLDRDNIEEGLFGSRGCIPDGHGGGSSHKKIIRDPRYDINTEPISITERQDDALMYLISKHGFCKKFENGGAFIFVTFDDGERFSIDEKGIVR